MKLGDQRRKFCPDCGRVTVQELERLLESGSGEPIAQMWRCIDGDHIVRRASRLSTRDELLLTMVDADTAHRPAREQFFMVETFGGVTIGHPRLSDEVKVNKPDVLDLIDRGYLRVTHGSNVVLLDVTDVGFAEATKLRLTGAMQEPESQPVTVMVDVPDTGLQMVETPADVEAERERLAEIATDFGWHVGFAQEPDGSWFWLVLDLETDEPIKSGTAPTWQDALLECVADLTPPSAED